MVASIFQFVWVYMGKHNSLYHSRGGGGGGGDGGPIGLGMITSEDRIT